MTSTGEEHVLALNETKYVELLKTQALKLTVKQNPHCQPTHTKCLFCRIHISVQIPHQDGMLPLVSTLPLHNLHFLLSESIYRQQHVCSNLVTLTDLKGITGNGPASIHRFILLSPTQFSAFWTSLCSEHTNFLLVTNKSNVKWLIIALSQCFSKEFYSKL